MKDKNENKLKHLQISLFSKYANFIFQILLTKYISIFKIQLNIILHQLFLSTLLPE